MEARQGALVLDGGVAREVDAEEPQAHPRDPGVGWYCASNMLATAAGRTDQGSFVPPLGVPPRSGPCLAGREADASPPSRTRVPAPLEAAGPNSYPSPAVP
jgi:hypothetical protein